MSPAPRDAALDTRHAGGVPVLWDELAGEVAAGRRFAGLFGTARPEGLLLSAHVAGPADIAVRETVLPTGATSYPALTPRLGAAFWYERAITDMFGVIPQGHPRPATSGPGGSAAALTRAEPSAWMVVPVIAGVAALLVLGVHPPAELTGLLTRAVHLLGGGA